jgi:hypothetical protein
MSSCASRTLCFWSIEGDNDSTITVWNYKAVAQDLVLTLYYFGGQYTIPIHLGPLETYNLDMRSLVNSQVPDPSGTVIPSNIESGSATLSGAGGETDTISVAVSASMFNVRNATCNSLCEQCNGATEVAFDPDAYAEAVGGTAQAQVQVTWNSGDVYTNPSGTVFTSSNSSIATINSSGWITGQSPGVTGVTFSLPDYPIYEVDCNGYMPCENGSPGGGGPNNTQPSVSISGPSGALVTTSIQLTATGSPSGGTYSWTASNSNVTLTNASSATVTVQGTTAGTSSVSVSYTVSEQAGSANQLETVQTPTSLKLVTAPPKILQQGTGPQHGCPPGYYGIAIDVDYQVLDQNGAPVASANMEPQELLTGGTGYTDIGGSQLNYPQSAQFTRADGTFDDVPIEKCPPVPVTTLTQFETQSIQILVNGTGYPVRTNTYSYSTTNLPNHGTITNGADINATQ